MASSCRIRDVPLVRQPQSVGSDTGDVLRPIGCRCRIRPVLSSNRAGLSRQRGLGGKLGYSAQSLADANIAAIAFLRDIASAQKFSNVPEAVGVARAAEKSEFRCRYP